MIRTNGEKNIHTHTGPQTFYVTISNFLSAVLITIGGFYFITIAVFFFPLLIIQV